MTEQQSTASPRNAAKNRLAGGCVCMTGAGLFAWSVFGVESDFFELFLLLFGVFFVMLGLVLIVLDRPSLDRASRYTSTPNAILTNATFAQVAGALILVGIGTLMIEGRLAESRKNTEEARHRSDMKLELFKLEAKAFRRFSVIGPKLLQYLRDYGLIEIVLRAPVDCPSHQDLDNCPEVC